MKTQSLLNKDTNYSLHNSENFKLELDCTIEEATKTYVDLIIDYFKFILENIKLKKNNLSRFIITRGLDTLIHVFKNVFFYTRNIELTYFHCQKSFYFYVEFVGQISDDEKTFLQLTSRDATTYVYKKTVFDISNELKKININNSDKFREKMDIIRVYTNLYQTYLLKIIHSAKINVLEIEHLSKIANKLNTLTDKSAIKLLESVTDNLFYKIENVDLFFEINHVLVQKYLKNPDTIQKVEKKIYSEDFNGKLIETNDKLPESRDVFTKWLLN